MSTFWSLDKLESRMVQMREMYQVRRSNRVNSYDSKGVFLSSSSSANLTTGEFQWRQYTSFSYLTNTMVAYNLSTKTQSISSHGVDPRCWSRSCWIFYLHVLFFRLLKRQVLKILMKCLLMKTGKVPAPRLAVSHRKCKFSMTFTPQILNRN